MKAWRPVYLLSLVCLFMVAGLWVLSFNGVGQATYIPQDKFAYDSGWGAAAEAGSLTFLQTPNLMVMGSGFRYGFFGFKEKDGISKESRLVGHFRFLLWPDKKRVFPGFRFYGFDCIRILSVPFWLPASMLAALAAFARRRHSRARAAVLSGAGE